MTSRRTGLSTPLMISMCPRISSARMEMTLWSQGHGQEHIKGATVLSPGTLFTSTYMTLHAPLRWCEVDATMFSRPLLFLWSSTATHSYALRDLKQISWAWSDQMPWELVLKGWRYVVALEISATGLASQPLAHARSMILLFCTTRLQCLQAISLSLSSEVSF